MTTHSPASNFLHLLFLLVNERMSFSHVSQCGHFLWKLRSGVADVGVAYVGVVGMSDRHVSICNLRSTLPNHHGRERRLIICLTSATDLTSGSLSLKIAMTYLNTRQAASCVCVCVCAYMCAYICMCVHNHGYMCV